ncbi:Outer membrane efflux protein [Stieleria maiorica]|uniref:Outer membrane efflux protein n=1 Tax=Stieleria maiorica TaxID=2795974 RepID=A0A5B9MS90_9BACT|nr:TolC family protein [Stieleria maiorica]QEG02706.1 Outer membrane efflux protein [Stieleria maiorica]
MPKRVLVLGLISCMGCATGPDQARYVPDALPAVPADQGVVETTANIDVAAPPEIAKAAAEPRVALETDDTLSLVDYIAEEDWVAETEQSNPARMPIRQVAAESGDAEQAEASVEMNLPSALAMVSGQHPIVGFARWRVQQAYAQLAQAEALWLPSIQAGFNFHRHDGNYQASNGDIVDVNRNSFQYGLGVGATGAGTTPRPGLVAQFHLADAIFQPRVAEATAWASGHAANATQNRQLLTAALAYIDLIAAHQDVSILEASRARTEELAKITGDFAEAGQGLKADADRMQTELALMENRLIAAEEQTAVASARLAEAISLSGQPKIRPMDVTVVPLELVPIESDKASLIAAGLAMRPELKESQALVAAACQAYSREKYAPFVPSVLLGFSTGGFGGGLGNELDDVNDRYDIDALMSWQVRNLGLGEKAARREQSARVQQAKYERIRVMDQVAREISEGHARVQSRHRQIAVTERAIEFAMDSYDRNLKRIRDGEGLPLEVLQSLQALETASRAYLSAVVDHNRAQFELQWAQGWPVQGG